MVPVGNPGNAGEWSGASYGGTGANRLCGAVDYGYSIGKYEVTAGQYTEFLNAVGGVDTYGLYTPEMRSVVAGCQIERYDGSGSAADPFQYRVASDFADRPVNKVSWNDTLRFANWLHNGQPTGLQNSTTTEDGAYDMSLGAGVVRKPGAMFFLPTEDEWYKAAYYDGATGSYFDYPTSSDTAPGYINDSGNFSGTGAPFIEGGVDPGGYATYNGDLGANGIGSPYYLTEVGEHENSPSPYGTFDQGGNIYEFNEERMQYSDGAWYRSLRGGALYTPADELLSSRRAASTATWYEDVNFGFRIAMVYELGFRLNGAPVGYSELLELITPLLASGDTLSGRGVYDGVITGAAASAIIADSGDMTLGDSASFAGFSTEGAIDTRGNTLTLQSAGFAALGIQTTLGGGTLTAPNGVALGTADNLVGSGTVDAKIAAGFGSTISATGDLALGDVGSYDGFFSDGTLLTGAHTVTINDKNTAVLGSLTQLGDEVDDGTLSAANGLTVEFGKNIVGRGTVNTPDDPLVPLTNNGAIIGDSPGAIELTGYVKGVGALTNVTVSGTFSPGLSPVRLHASNLEIAANGRLIIELGGLSGGSEYDQLVVAGDLHLGGTLQVTLIDGFAPNIDDTFSILYFDDLDGTEFDAVELPDLAGRKAWDLSELYSTGEISVIEMLDGDTDGDRDVDDADYQAFVSVFGDVGDRYTDFNGNGKIDLGDFVLLRANFGAGVNASAPGNAATATPEPATLILMAAGLPLLLKRRRSRSGNPDEPRRLLGS
jgi:formylglycine-generating enzyme required for sulfatase activity